MIPKKLYVRKFDIYFLYEEINETRAWVANKPCTGRREYTDLSQVWHPAEEEPEKGRYFLVDKANGEPDVWQWTERDYGWENFVFVIGLKRWAYIEDLFPKGGENGGC